MSFLTICISKESIWISSWKHICPKRTKWA